MGDTHDKSQQVRYGVNIWVLAVTVITLGVIVPGVYLWHSRAVAQMSESLLQTAGDLIQQVDANGSSNDTTGSDDKLRQAVNLIWQYRRINPDDPQSAVLLAQTFDRAPQGQANRKRAAQLYVEAVARSADDQSSDDQNLDKLRLRAAEIFLEIADWTGAEQIARNLVNSPDDNLRAPAQRILATALVRQVRGLTWSGVNASEVGTALQQAITSNPADTQLPVDLAVLYRNPDWHRYLNAEQQQKLQSEELSVVEMAEKTADQIVDQMVQRSLDRLSSQPDDAASESDKQKQNLAQAYFQRWQYRHQFDLEGSDGDLQLARQYDPQDTDIALEQGRILLREYQLEIVAAGSARGSLSEGQKNKLTEARDLFQFCLANNRTENNPNVFAAQLYLGDVLMAQGDANGAVASWTGLLGEIQNENIQPGFLASVFRRLVGALLELDRTDEAQSQLDGLKQLIQRVSTLTGDPSLLTELVQTQRLLEGMLHFKNRAYANAISTLEDALANRRGQSQQLTISMVRVLADIYLYLDQASQAAKVLQVATDLDSSDAEFRMNLSRVHEENGRYELAADVYEPLVRQDDATWADWLHYANLLYQQESAKPGPSRNWSAFNNALQRTRQLSGGASEDDRWQTDLLDVQAQVAGNASSLNAANQSLDSLAAQANDDPQRAKELAVLFQQSGQFDKSDLWLGKYQELVGEVPDRYILAAELLASRGDFEGAGQQLSEGLSRVEDGQRQALELAQIGLMLNNSEFEQAITTLESLVAKYPKSPDLVLKLADLVVQLPNQIQAQSAQWEQELERLEGGNGPYTQALRAQRALLDFEGSQDPQQRTNILNIAVDSIERVIQSRSDWPIGHALAGVVYQTRGEFMLDKANAELTPTTLADRAGEQIELARQHFHRAVDLGDRRSWVLLRLAELDPPSTKRLLSLVDPRQVFRSRGLSNLQVALQESNNDLDNAQRVAVRATESRPDDPYAWLDRARIEIMRQSNVEALQSFSRCRELKDKTREPRQLMRGMFTVCLLAQQQFSASPESSRAWKERARELVPEILERVDDQNRLLEEAKLLAEIGDDKARGLFLEAEQQQPDNVDVLQTALRYFSTRNQNDPDSLDQAIRLARKLFQFDVRDVAYRRQLASLLALRGTADDWSQIQLLLSEGEVQTMADRRVTAALLLSRTDLPNTRRLQNLERAAALIQNTQAAADLTLRGQIFKVWADILGDVSGDVDERNGKLDQAATCFAAAASAPDANDYHLARAITFFIDQPQWASDNQDSELWQTPEKRLELADSYLRKMENLSAESVTRKRAAVALRAKWMQQQANLAGTENSDAIIQLIEDYGQQIQQNVSLTKPTRAQYYQAVADMLDSIDAPETDVVKWRRKAVDEDPDQRLRLALQLLKNGDLDRALDESVIGYGETSKPDYVIAITNLLVSADVQQKHLDKADPVLKSAIRDFPNHAPLIGEIANVRLVAENRVEDAIELFEMAVSLRPDNWILLNNLATAYAEVPEKLPQALQTIERAISIGGPRTALIDCRAVIWMLQGGNLDRAEAELRDILNQNSDARYWCHLAEVMWKKYERSDEAKDLLEAHTALTKALEKNLQQLPLTRGERQRLASLQQNLDSHPATTATNSSSQ